MRSDQKVEAISRVPLFAGCSKRDLRKIAAIADPIDLPEGQVLTRQGAPGREFFVLLEGAADVLQDGKRVATLGKGDFFGEAALISRRPRNATITTTTPVGLLVVTERDFRELLDTWPPIRGKILAALADRLPPEPI